MSFNPELCTGCPIAGQYDPIEAKGQEGARFLIVTDRPSQAAAAENRLLTPLQMQVFTDQMVAQGFGRGDFRFTPACHCSFNENDYPSKQRSLITKHCRAHLLAEIEQGGSEVVIPLGADATSQTFGRSTRITKVKGIATNCKEFTQPVFALLSPGLVVRYPQNAPVFNADVQSFGRFVNSGYDAEQVSVAVDHVNAGNYEFVDDLEFLIDMDFDILSFDTENTGLSWFQQGCDVRTYRPAIHKGNPLFKPKMQILTMQFSIEPGKGYMLIWDHPEHPIAEAKKPKLRNQLRRLLCNPDRIVVGQGNKYDNVILWMCEGIRYRIGGDTLMMATLNDENMPEKNLDILTKIHVPHMAGYADKFNATVDKSRMWEVPLDTMLGYGVGDSDAALQVYLALEDKIAQDAKLWNHYRRVSLPGLNAFAAIETRGMFVDEGDALATFKQTMIEEVEAMRVDLLDQIPTALKRDVVQSYVTYSAKGVQSSTKTPDKALSFSRTDFLKQVLFTHPSGFCLTPRVFTKSTEKLTDQTLREPSTSAKDHLPYFFDTCPFTYQLAEYVKDESLLTKSIISFEKKYIVRGKVRPTYHLHKAVTGRSSSENPNGQNTPKRGARAKAYRKMYKAPPGYFIIEADESQAELRIAACMSGDPTMIEIYRTGGDIHRATACIVLGVTMDEFNTLPKKEQKEARQKAKAVNFGFLYGMWWRKFIGYAKTQYGVVFTENEAKRVRTAFFRLYSGLEPWHNRMKAFAERHKYVRSLSGRIRHLPMIDSSEEYIQQEAGRQAINSPVQGFGSDLGVMAAGEIEEQIDPEYLQVVGFVHDALIFYVKKEYLDWGMKIAKAYMQSPQLKDWFGLELPVPIVADASFGENLGDMHECEGLTLEDPFDFETLAEDGVMPVEVPPQLIPPNNGRRTRSAYTLPDDLEPEDVAIPQIRLRRPPMPVVSREAQKRVTRSQAQMIINRRNEALRIEEARAQRARPLIRRSPK